MTASQISQSARELYRSAIHSARSGKYDEAIAHLTEVLFLQPRFAEAYFRRAEVFRITYRYENAIKDYHKAIRFKENFGIAYKYRAVCYAQVNAFGKALSDMDRFIEFQDEEMERAKHYKFRTQRVPNKLRREKAWALNFRANIYALKKDLGAAIKDFNEALVLDPQYFEVYYHRAVVYEKQGNIKRALVDFRRFEQHAGGSRSKEQLERLQIAKNKIKELSPSDRK